MKMPYRKLGKTGLCVSAIGFGGIPIQKASVKQAVSLIQKAGKAGINFIDTARVYGDSEKKIGLALKEQQNCSFRWIIASKSPATSYKEMMQDIKESLKQLKTKYIDLYQLHHVSSEDILEKCLENNGSYRALLHAKKKAWIGHIGITSHDIHVALKAVKTGKFETIMIPYSFRNQDAEHELIPYCNKHGIGIIAMKPLDGGTIKYPTQAVRFCLTKPISTTIPGIYLDKELKRDVIDVLNITEQNEAKYKITGLQSKTAKFKLSAKDKALLKKDRSEKGYHCRVCGYCATMYGGCPKKINIPFFMKAEAYLKKYGPKKWLIDACNKMSSNPKNCILCGHCENHCPYNLPIMKILRNLKISNYILDKEPRKMSSLHNIQKQIKELDDLAKNNERIKKILYVKWNYKRSSNPGQKATVMNLITQFMKKNSNKEQTLVKKLNKEMKLDGKNLRELVMLSDYDNIVDMMRALQEELDK